MTDRIVALTVVLDGDLREDDTEPIVQAIGMIRGVLTVEKHVADWASFSALQRARQELREALWAALK